MSDCVPTDLRGSRSVRAHGRDQAEGVVILDPGEVAELAELYDPRVMMVSLPMLPPTRAEAHARALVHSGPRQGTAELSTATADPAQLLPLAERGAPHADAWAEFLTRAAIIFGDLLGARGVGVRQIVADEPHCSRFHVDQVAARGVLHVTGPTTEWLINGAADRARLGHRGGTDDMQAGVVRSWSGLRSTPPASLTVFKGAAWPGAEQAAVVHRSPASSGRRRLLVTLDALR